MLIRDWVQRIGGDIAHDPLAATITLALAAVCCWAMAYGLLGAIEDARRATRTLRAWLNHRRLDKPTRLAVREPGRALAADDDRAIWRETQPAQPEPDPQPRPRCTPRQPTAFEIHQLHATATQLCRQAAQTIRRDDG